MHLIRKPLVALAALFTLFGVLGPTHLTGVQGASSGQQDHRQYSWRSQIQYLNPDRTPFLQMMSRLSEEKVSDFEFKVFERDHPSRWTRLNEALDTSETGVDVDDGTMFRADDVVLVPSTGEMLYVSSISGNTLTVIRGYNGTTGTAANDNDWLKLLYSAEPENGVAPAIVTTDTTTVTNFTQIFKRSYGLSGTRKAMSFRSDPHSLPGQRKLAMELLKEDMEQAFLWGRKAVVSNGTGGWTRYTGGLNQFVSTNRIDMDGGWGFGDIGYLMNVATRFGSSRKVWLCGRDARQQIDSLGLEYRQIGGEAKKLGFTVTGFRTSFGEAMLTTHMGLDNAHAGHTFVMDPSHARIARLRKLKHDQNIQTPGTDGEQHQFIGELGLWIDTEKAHMVLYNITKKLV